MPVTVAWEKIGLPQWGRLFLSQGCPVCDRATGKRSGQTFCIDCQRQIPGLHPRSEEPRPTEGSHAHPTGICVKEPSVQDWYHDDSHPLPISALGPYNGPLKRAILAMKYGNRPEVAAPLGSALGQQWLNRLSHTGPSPIQRTPHNAALYALPIPLHSDRQAIRGFNQAELIAQAFCQISGIPLLVEGLARTQATLPQHQLTLSARQENLEEAFQVGPALRRGPNHTRRERALAKKSPTVLLIDDIYTTGTTARSAAKTLSNAGIQVIGMLAVARAVL